MRWDADERGEGVADAARFADDADELTAAMRRANWVAEPASYIRQRRSEDGATLTFEVVTGIVDEGPFTPHGHTLRLSVAPGLR
jgi:hypothetical protein